MTDEQLSKLKELTSYDSERDWDETEEYEMKLIKHMTEKKGEYIAIIQRVIDEDNILARKVGLKEVKLIDIGYSEKEHYVLPYVELDVDGKIVKLTETNMRYAFIDDKVEAYFRHCLAKTFFIAGSVTVEKCDFIFGNVGYSTEGRLYKITD